MKRLAVPPLCLLAIYLALPWALTDAWLPPSLVHPLGTDEFGRDLLANVILSTGLSALKGLGLAVLAFAFAGLVAYFAVVRGSRTVAVLLRGMTNVVESIPVLLWVLVAVIAINEPRVLVVALAFSIAALPAVSTVIAGELERLVHTPFIEAARMLGVREAHLLWRYLLPNAAAVLAPLVIQVLGAAIAVDGAIGVLGMGNRSQPDLGVMLLRGKENFTDNPQILLLAVGMFAALYAYLIWVERCYELSKQESSRVSASPACAVE